MSATTHNQKCAVCERLDNDTSLKDSRYIAICVRLAYARLTVMLGSGVGITHHAAWRALRAFWSDCGAPEPFWSQRRLLSAGFYHRQLTDQTLSGRLQRNLRPVSILCMTYAL